MFGLYFVIAVVLPVFVVGAILVVTVRYGLTCGFQVTLVFVLAVLLVLLLFSRGFLGP